MQIIPVASGKGGVGKSLLSANMAIALAQSGKKVVLADLDLGASNLHLVLGQSSPKTGIGTWISERSDFDSIITVTDYENLNFIAGDSEIPGLSSLGLETKRKLISNLLNIKADYLVLDLGAGTHSIILDMFLLSPQGIVVTAPTVTATLNAYLFLKNAVFKLINSTFKNGSAGRKWLNKLKKTSQSMQRLYIPKMIEELGNVDAENTAILKRRMEKFCPRLIINMIDDPKDTEKALKIRRSCTQYLGLDIEYLGVMYRDAYQDKALSSRLPVIVYKPQSILSQGIFRIADKIIASEAVSFDTDLSSGEEGDQNDSFSAISEEAEEDYTQKMESLQDLIGGGTFSTGELSEMIKTLQFDMTQLKKENNLLKSKLVKAAEQGFKV
ncbi:P-loop NTPase [Treponema parvum]|uniref:P-loop NTPase n=1 Tax=Treponema parvum TaxID=138851 RepID=A0A975F1D6_9SPIR|nr:P-loop NTPase [Treponema parvum]QTQ12490.1 P-loop NTPase [Treponema parvum]QTQ15515.1 P-loop NTPase [Treponema parvum]